MTVRATDVAQLDIAAVNAAFEACIRESSPDQLPMALRLLARLQPERWMLEWYLPWWLGDALGLDRGVSREIVLSNLLGLGSIRLQDDLADGEVASDEVDAAGHLAAALYQAALRPYEAWFEPASPFWDYLARCMGAWQAATSDADVDGDVEQRLAARGAPLKISAFAVCLLAGRATAYPALEPCLDHALSALVRSDHLADWRADLDAGRWNAFVADVSNRPQLPEERSRNRQEVLVAMMTSDPVASQVARIRDGFLRAAALVEAFAESEDVALPDLVDRLRRLATDVDVHGESLAEHYRDLGDLASKLMSQAPADARS